jgi:hypothetical protein
MKMKFLQSAVLASSLSFASNPGATANYAVHEWGTFTSVQGANGTLLPWHSLQVSELPKFVYDWTKPGLNRRSMAMFSKVTLETLQRMETPVVYFYANQPMSVDLDVAFPKGSLTEWYPQATQIGPSLAADTNGPSSGILRETRIVWRNLALVPASNADTSLQGRLSQDASGSHYFAARETAANFVQDDFTTPTNTTTEFEKFLFYRGAGSFKTPLRVTLDTNSVVTVENTGPQLLTHLFLLSIHNGRGAFGVMDELSASNSVTWLPLDLDNSEHWHQFPLPQFQSEIDAQMQTALVSEGLFPDEAKAMVNTWNDSWFTEDGVRVLYLLPRPWTDETLPMTLNPRPTNLTRVMVGRAEIIPPNVETNLFQLLTKAQNGDTGARDQASVELKKLGRFAEPALRLANTHADQTNIVNLGSLGYQLINPTRSTFE